MQRNAWAVPTAYTDCTNKEVYFLMNNLTTRKIVLGMLMALVLAFSVQGIADALTFSTSRSGDLETKAPNETFTIRFSVSLKGNTAIRKLLAT